MIDWYKKVVFENYANFSGRARRSEYWYFVLANLIIGVLLMIVDSALGLKIGNSNSGILNSLYNLAVLIPGLAVAVRRLHDIGKSGKLLLLFYGLMIAFVLVMVVSGLAVYMSNGGVGALGIGVFLPLLGILGIAIWMLILFCREGDRGENKYGSDPKAYEEEIIEVEA